MCNVSNVTHQMSRVTFFLQSVGASLCRVCYQRDLPRLDFYSDSTPLSLDINNLYVQIIQMYGDFISLYTNSITLYEKSIYL